MWCSPLPSQLAKALAEKRDDILPQCEEGEEEAPGVASTLGTLLGSAGSLLGSGGEPAVSGGSGGPTGWAAQRARLGKAAEPAAQGAATGWAAQRARLGTFAVDDGADFGLGGMRVAVRVVS